MQKILFLSALTVSPVYISGKSDAAANGLGAVDLCCSYKADGKNSLILRDNYGIYHLNVQSLSIVLIY